MQPCCREAMQSIKKLTLHLVLFTLVFAAVIYVLGNFLKPEWIDEHAWEVLSFFAILTWLTGALTNYLLQINKENSVNIILGGIALRFLASLGFVALYVVFGVENIILFVVNFFAIYLFYLVFDMYGLITNLRPISK